MSAPGLQQTLESAVEDMYQGRPEEAAAAFARAVESAAVIDTEALADSLERRASQKRAVDTLFSQYPEIRADGDMSALADVYVDRHLREGKRIEVAIADAGEELATKFGLGKHKPASARRSSGGNQASDSANSEVDPQRAVALEGLAWLQSTRHGNPSSS